MKKNNWSLVVFCIAFFVSCGTNENRKKNEDKLADSLVNNESSSSSTVTSPTLEKEFNDSVSKNKPEKNFVLLKFNLQKGKTYNYIMRFDVSKKKGEEVRGSNMTWNYDVKVIDEKNKLKTVEITYRQIEMTMNMGNDQKMEFSSEKKVDAMDIMQMPSKMFSIIKGKSFTMQVNNEGEVVAVTGFNEIGETVINEMGLPAEMKPMLQQNFKKQFNDEAVKQMFSQSFQIFPNRYVKVGDNWKINTNIPALKQDATTKYTVKNIKGKQVFLTGDSNLKSIDGKNAGTQTSKLIIDARTGLMIDGVFDQKSTDGQMNSKSRITGKEI